MAPSRSTSSPWNWRRSQSGWPTFTGGKSTITSSYAAIARRTSRRGRRSSTRRPAPAGGGAASIPAKLAVAGAPGYQGLDHWGGLGTTINTISGGEPLLHPDLDLLIARVRSHGMIAGMITNGYLLTADRIQRLNSAGLEHLQISIDNVMPDAVSKKSLKVLDRKLLLLAEHADFHVNINSVVCGGIHTPQDALAVGRRALALGFTSTVGIIHDGD